MIRIKGHLQMSENMYEVIMSREKSLEDLAAHKYTEAFQRLIDPVLVGTLFGLYKSQELPPIDKEQFNLDKSHEFNVDISSFAEILNHFLFCLWVQKKGAPNKNKDIEKFRKELYHFISKLLNADYYRTVLIPFYIDKADQAYEKGTSSFLHRLASSDDVKLVLEDFSPEFLAREFTIAQTEFINTIIKPLEKVLS